MSKGYNNFNCCDETLGVDNLLNRYKQDRQNIVDMMDENGEQIIKEIWKINSPLSIDNRCLCQVGKKPLATYICAQCHNLRRIMDYSSQSINEPFDIQCGELEGERLFVKDFNISNLSLGRDLEAEEKSREYLAKHKNLTSCGTPNLSDFTCISGDSFTISSLVNIFLYENFEELGLPHIDKIQSAFVCHEMGYHIYQIPDIGSFDELVKIEEYIDEFGKLKGEIVKGIILQLVVIYHELGKFYFSHGKPDLSSLLFDSNPCEYNYGDIRIRCPVTVILSNFCNSSLNNFSNCRYFSKSFCDEINLKKITFSPNIEIRESEMSYCSKNKSEICSGNYSFYKLDDDSFDVFNTMRHLGLPLFTSSFDFYFTMIALKSRKEFDLESHNVSANIWQLMWSKEDLESLNERMQIKGENITILSLIKGLWLRCNPLQVILKYLDSF